jgi:uncharacterized caspase-like protein
MRTAIALLASLACALLLVASAGAGENAAKRVALVIGNSKYRYAKPLPNPANDARLISATLREAGFEVLERADLDRSGMSETINQFTEMAFDADVALIYYAGHGIQVEGSNYLIPVDSELTTPAHLKTRTTTIDALVAALPPDPAVGIVILDACRDNPLTAQMVAALPATRSLAVGSGLAAVQTIDAGTGAGGILIAYATDPGSVAVDGAGDNSPYSTALARHLTTPGLELQSALTRVRGDVTASTLGRQRPWHNASLGREVFLGRTLPAPVEPAPQASLPPPDPEISTVERILWEEASKRDTADFYMVYLEQYPAGRFARIAALNIERLKAAAPTAAERSAAAAGEVQVARAEPVLILGGNGSASTPDREPPEPRRVETTALDEAVLDLDLPRREDLQLRLQALGLEPGPIDGDVGRASRRAIARWQEGQGLAPTGFLSTQQYAALVAATDPLMPELRIRHEASLQPDQERQSPVILPQPVEPADVAEPDDASETVPPPAAATPAPAASPEKKRIIRNGTKAVDRPNKPLAPKSLPQKKIVKKRTANGTAGRTVPAPAPNKTARKQTAAAPAAPKPSRKYKVIGRDNIFGSDVIYGNGD